MKIKKIPLFLIVVLLAAGVICGIVSLILHQKGHFRYVNRDDLVEAGPEGDELWGWVEDDQRGPYTGWMKEWGWKPKSGNRGGSYLEAKYFMKAGKKDGKYERWSDSGQKIEEGHFDDGRQGSRTKWYENGQKKSTVQVARRGLFIESVIAWKPNGMKCPITRVVKGSGTWVAYYENGQKELETHYKDGKKDGLLTRWHENGKKDGLLTRWHENGQKELETHYKDGKKDGLRTWWYENGQKWGEHRYKDGKVDGLFTTWHENGQKRLETHYKDGKKDGLLTLWGENGQKAREIHYKDGQKLNETHYKDGVKVEE